MVVVFLVLLFESIQHSEKLIIPYSFLFSDETIMMKNVPIELKNRICQGSQQG